MSDGMFVFAVLRNRRQIEPVRVYFHLSDYFHTRIHCEFVDVQSKLKTGFERQCNTILNVFCYETFTYLKIDLGKHYERPILQKFLHSCCSISFAPRPSHGKKTNP